MAAGLITAQSSLNGLQPMQLRRDLAAIADLIEYAFAPSLDAAGRSAIQEMRLISRTGPLLWALGRLNSAIPGLSSGFVWYENGKLVGNVSISSTGFDRGWVIANVAVYPEYRRRGIARRMMQASLDWIAKHGTYATLQVEANNSGARSLYLDMGFQEQRTLIRWRRPSQYVVPPPLPGENEVRLLARHDTAQLLALAERIRPNERGGLGWLRPTEKKRLRPPRFGGALNVMSDHRMSYWGLMPKGALITEQRFGLSTILFDVLAEDQLSKALLINYVVRTVAGRYQPLVTDHPADDWVMTEILRENHFVPERELVHMVRDGRTT